MNEDRLNPFADLPNSITVHPGWSEFHYLLTALTSLLLLLAFIWLARWLDNRASSRKARRGANSGVRAL